MAHSRLERRLRTLESSAGVPDPDEREEQQRHEVLRRMTDEELWRWHEVLEAAHERGEDPIQWRGEDLPILRRVQELEEEVAAEFNEETQRKERA